MFCKKRRGHFGYAYIVIARMKTKHWVGYLGTEEVNFPCNLVLVYIKKTKLVLG